MKITQILSSDKARLRDDLPQGETKMHAAGWQSV